MKKETITIIILIIIIIAIIVIIYYIKANENQDDPTIKCIASKSKIIVSPTCSACAYQKQILGDYLNYFEILSITEHPELLEQYNLDGVPTWIINEEKYPGVQSIEKLKQITGC